jgi:hypothetical protein
MIAAACMIAAPCMIDADCMINGRRVKEGEGGAS